jgi:hypothetical protein
MTDFNLKSQAQCMSCGKLRAHPDKYPVPDFLQCTICIGATPIEDIEAKRDLAQANLASVPDLS